VPLSNETFGDSVVKAAAAVGVTLVAAVGAITPVIGRVRGEEVDLPLGVEAQAPVPSGEGTRPPPADSPAGDGPPTADER
jgi:hypothetical protein